MTPMISTILKLKRTVNPTSMSEAPGGLVVQDAAEETEANRSRHIVFGIKGYDESLAARDWALLHVCRPGDTLCFIHVIEETAPSGCFMCRVKSCPESREAEEDGVYEIEEMLGRFASGAFMTFMVNAEIVIRHGQVGPAIVEEAANRNAAAIVLGSSGEDTCHFSSHPPAGSTAINAYCQRRARCPVVSVEQRHRRCGARHAAMAKRMPAGPSRARPESPARKVNEPGPLQLTPFQRAELQRLQKLSRSGGSDTCRMDNLAGCDLRRS